MIKFFTLISIIVVSVVLFVGLGIYGLSKIETQQTKREAAEMAAKGFALGVSSQMELLQKTLDKMSKDPEVLAAIYSNNTATIDAAASKLEHHIPDTLKIRLLQPGISEPDKKAIPRMGYADLDMVSETFSKNQPPAIQGDKGPDRHLAVARQVVHNGKVIAVLLASMNPEIINHAIQKAVVENSYIALKQGKLVLASNGEASPDDEPIVIDIPNSNWSINYQANINGNYNELLLVSSILLLSVLIILLTVFITYRKLSDVLTEDLRSVMKAFKDMMSSKMQGNYPVELTEMSNIISTLAQFKRVLDNENQRNAAINTISNLVVSDDADYELDDFFNNSDDFKL
ncbi:hypothetical protein JCM14076_02270 [Methylosoma difficile]